MSIKKIFLCHYSGDRTEVADLASTLRLHGTVPWVDKDGGFALGDYSESEARRAIREDCFGLLLYASKDVFERPFIRDVEIDEAVRVKASDSSFALFATPRNLSFDELRERSIASFGIDLSAFHAEPIPQNRSLATSHTALAKSVLERVLSFSPPLNDGSLSLQFSTRELMPDANCDVLRIDATGMFRESVEVPRRWRHLLKALQNVKKALSETCGRPRLTIHGSKHLTAAFIFGRVFSPFELDIRQTPTEVWRTYGPTHSNAPLSSELRAVDPHSSRVFVEVAFRFKNVGAGVDSLIAAEGIQPVARLQIAPENGPLTLDESLCRAAVTQTYAEIEKVLQHYPCTEIHVFAAVPQSFMMMLGKMFRGMPPVHLYEWTGDQYVRSCQVPRGVL